MTFRPGPLLVQALLALVLLALLVPVVHAAVWALALGLLAVVGLAVREALALRSILILAEQPPSLVLSLDEEEPLTLRLSTSAARPVRLTVRQVWPDLLVPPSTRLAGVCRPGEVLALETRVRAVARGGAVIPLPSIAASLAGWTERVTTAGQAT